MIYRILYNNGNVSIATSRENVYNLASLPLKINSDGTINNEIYPVAIMRIRHNQKYVPPITWSDISVDCDHPFKHRRELEFYNLICCSAILNETIFYFEVSKAIANRKEYVMSAAIQTIKQENRKLFQLQHADQLS